MLQAIPSAKQSPSQQKAPLATRRGHCLVNDCFIAPNETAADIHHSPEEIHILAARREFSSESFICSPQDFPPEDNIPGSRFRQADAVSGFVCRPLKEPAPRYPFRRFLFEVRLHWPKHTIRSSRVACLEKRAKPVCFRILVIVNKCDEVPLRICQRLVTS